MDDEKPVEDVPWYAPHTPSATARRHPASTGRASVSRRCVDERGARFVADSFTKDTARAGWCSVRRRLTRRGGPRRLASGDADGTIATSNPGGAHVIPDVMHVAPMAAAAAPKAVHCPGRGPALLSIGSRGCHAVSWSIGLDDTTIGYTNGQAQHALRSLTNSPRAAFHCSEASSSLVVAFS
jgi:hypothetical protein